VISRFETIFSAILLLEMRITPIRFVALFVLAVVLWTVGYWVNEFFFYTRTRPIEAELAGRYVPSGSTLADMRSRGRYDVSAAKTNLILRDDASFEMIEMPDWWLHSSGESWQGYHHWSGTWSIKQNSSDKTWSLALTTGQMTTSADLANQKPPYAIYFVLGDPDEHEGMTFVKANE
jgi:hypothetical protein